MALPNRAPRYGLRRALVCALVAVALAVAFERTLRVSYATHDPRRSAVLVTGASTGIGRAAAIALLAHGFVVYAGVRDEAAALDLVASHGSRMRPLLLDVTNPSQIDAAFANVTEHAQVAGGGQLVGLVNNAGVTYKRPMETADLDRVRELIEVNVLGALAVTQRFLPLLRRSRGRVVNVGSVQGIVAMPMHGPYAVTKHALEALSGTLRQELSPHGVSVSLVSPGYVNTPLRQKGSPAREAALSPVEVAVYGDRFAALQRKEATLSEHAPACCSQTDAAIIHALTDRHPRTRYYPFTAAVKLGDAFPAWLAALLIRATSVHPTLDRLQDLVLARLL